MNVKFKWDIFVNEEQRKGVTEVLKYNIFLTEQKIYISFILKMKHDVTASISVYLCFINSINHYTSICMFITLV